MKLDVYVFEYQSFQKKTSILGHTDWIRSIKIARYTNTHSQKRGFDDGDLMVLTSSQDKYIRIWKISKFSSDISEPEDDVLGLSKIDLNSQKQLSTKAHVFQIEGNCFSFILDAICMAHDDWVFSATWAPESAIGILYLIRKKWFDSRTSADVICFSFCRQNFNYMDP